MYIMRHSATKARVRLKYVRFKVHKPLRGFSFVYFSDMAHICVYGIYIFACLFYILL